MFKTKKDVRPVAPTLTTANASRTETLTNAGRPTYAPGSPAFQQRYLGNSHVQASRAKQEPAPTESSQRRRPGKMSVSVSSPTRSSSENDPSKAISASGAATVSVTYKPEAADTSTKIVFLQVMREYLDGSPVIPSVLAPAFAYQDADTTPEFYHVDYVSGETDPYYNGDDAADGGTQGNATAATKVDATMTDTPNFSDGSFPTGKTKMKWEFRTIAFSAAGADDGTYYAYARWTYEKDKGSPATITHQGTSTNTALPLSKAAITLWCTNHGFALPT